ncbi:MAG TPA: cytochrome c-type biogenesis protein [Rhizomicrobium sp.]|jgi:cytochrome c-type biogenesis protein CcmH
MTRALATLAFALLISPVVAAPLPERLPDPKLETRAVELQKQLRCLVCQGQSLDESNAPLAADLRRLIRERIAAGDTNEEVQRYLVARYGDFVLMKPPLKPDTYILWLGPLVVLLAGGATVALVAGKAKRRAAAGGPAAEA